MGYIYSQSSNCMTIWGVVPRDAKMTETKSGKFFTSFSVRYNRKHNEDGQMVNEYMNCQMWGDEAKIIGADDVGIAKGDIVFVCGRLVPDTYHKEGEDPPENKWKLDVDIVLDMTSIFQVAQMVVDGGGAVEQEDTAPSTPKFTETTEKTPFMEEIEESDGELPF